MEVLIKFNNSFYNNNNNNNTKALFKIDLKLFVSKAD